MNVTANASVLAACKPWTRAEIAARAAHDIQEGFYVNLGIGIPVLVADHLPADREIIIQSETGESRLKRRCSYPLTAPGVVKRVYTNLAVLDVTDEGFVVRDMVPGLTLEALRDVTEARLRMAN